MDKQYVYIFSHTTSPKNIIKVGETKGEPHIRAKGLSKTVRGEHIVEWYIEVPDSKAAEKLAHIHLKRYHDEKEYFDIGIEKAAGIIKKAVIAAFELEDPYCFEGPFLREIARQNALKESAEALLLRQKAQLILLEQEAEREAEQILGQFQEQNQPVVLSGYGILDRLEQFVNEVYKLWSQKQTGLNGLTTKEISDDGEQYVMKLMSEKQGFDVVLTPHSRTPVDAFGIKWRGYFWHLIMIQVKTSTTKSVKKLTADDYETIRNFGRFVKEEYFNSELYREYRDKPIVFSVGLANVKNHRPTVNRCTLIDAEFINWYWSKLPKDKTNRIKKLVEEAHYLK